MDKEEKKILFRDLLTEKDIAAIGDLVRSTGVFNPCEMEMAEELARETYAKGPEISGYHFILAEMDHRIVGYACFGPITCSENRYDLYWIVIQNDRHRSGIGKGLLAKSEQRIAELGGVKVYVETSSLSNYEAPRLFYLRQGYQQEAILKDYYREGDDKVIFRKNLSGENKAHRK
jgi:ribosomal protein S18 acetylase RimI-like enzyme